MSTIDSDLAKRTLAAPTPCVDCANLARELHYGRRLWELVELMDAVRQHERETGHRVDQRRSAE